MINILKKSKTVVLILLLLTIILTSNAYADENKVTLNGVTLDITGFPLGNIQNNAYILLKTSTKYIYISDNSVNKYFYDDTLYSLLQDGSSSFDTYIFDLDGNYIEHKAVYNVTGIAQVVYTSTNIYIQSNGEYFPKNNNYKFSYGSKVTINNPLGIMFSRFTFKKSSVPMMGIITLLDEDGNFYEQYDFGPSISNLEIDIPTGTTHILFNYMPQYLDDYLYIDQNEYSNQLIITEYIPTYKIVGGSTVLLNGLELPNVIPKIKSNYTTKIFYQYEENDLTKTKMEVLNSNTDFTFQPNKEYLIKFGHAKDTTIRVSSNFRLSDTNEQISFMSDEDLEDLIIDNGGVLEQDKRDLYLEVDRFKALKIKGLNEGTVTESVTIDIQGDTNSNADIHVYSYNWDNLFKSNEIKQIGNQGKYRLSIPSNNGYIVIQENNGKTYVRIDDRFKENENFSYEYISAWTPDSALDEEYHAVNPIPTPIEDMNDGTVKPVKDNFWDSIFGGDSWSGINPDEQQNTSDFTLELDTVKNVSKNVSSFTEIFVEPVKTLFTGIAEIYYLIIFGFGLSLVLFILGR